MAADRNGNFSAVDNSALSPEKTSLLKEALRPLPRSLSAGAEEEQLIEHALGNASGLFAVAEEEWRGFERASHLMQEANRPLQRAVQTLVRYMPDAQLGARAAALGALLVIATLTESSIIAEARPLAAVLVVVGLLTTFLPRLSRVLLRALRLRKGIDLRWLQARLRGASPLFSVAGQLMTAVGLLLLISSLAVAQSHEFREIAAGICGLGLVLFTLPRTVRLLLGGLLLLDYPAATVRWEAARQRLKDRLRAEGQMVIREKLNVEAVRPYKTTLSFKDHSGLGEIDDPRREIPTGARQQLLHKVARLPGGTIGLAGSRGAGKTTLMRSICTAPSTRAKDEPPLSFVVDAPVRYESRDFVLYLFAQVCSKIVGPDRVRDMRGSDRPFGSPGITSGRHFDHGRWRFGAGCMGAGAILLFLALVGVDDATSPFAWGAVLLFLGYFAISVETLSARQQRRHLGPGGTSSSEEDSALVDLAILRLRQIWFQQSFSTGWSGSFKIPMGEGGIKGSADLAEQQLSLPDIVALFREFLSQVALRREVRIGIDELDKMDDETAREFLNDIKVIFRIQDCFFLISISEDAMSFFERRGLPIRDVFDSSFDDVQYVPHLRFTDSRKLLERRIVELPVPFAGLLHCISGGLPRDLVRAARELVDIKEKTPLDETAARLLRNSMQAKIRAGKVVARGFELGEHSTLLISWLDRLLLAKFNAAALLPFCESFKDEILGNLRGLPTEPVIAAERRHLQALATQLVTFVYYAATALEFFPKLTDHAYMDEILEAAESDDTPSHLDELANVAQTFAVDITSAWAMTSRFRERIQLDPIHAFPRLGDPSLAAIAGDGDA